MQRKGGKRRKEPEEPDRNQVKFFRSVSDRLKTPVTVTGLALQRLEGAETEEERKKFLEMAKRSQQEMSRTVEELLETARQN